jgi:Uncharacterized protein involved in methicillin resistance
MIILKTNSKILSVKTIYFAQKPSLKNCFFSAYRSTGVNKDYFFFKRSSINTLINDLNVTEAELFRSFKKQTKYEINRSIRDNLIEIDLQATMDDFIPLYNRFAAKRGWRSFKVREEMLHNLHVTTCKQNDKIIISHLYFLDYNSKRVCLESTVSDLCCTDDIHYKALLGRANRHLHYSDMLYFKNQGFESYDFGGYDNHNINDKKKLGINKFKESFKGVLVFESNYTSYPLLVLFKIKKIARLLEISR